VKSGRVKFPEDEAQSSLRTDALRHVSWPKSTEPSSGAGRVVRRCDVVDKRWTVCTLRYVYKLPERA